MKKTQTNPNSLANLKPCKPGEARNPWGLHGKDGTKGFSLKENYRMWLSKLNEKDRAEIWKGLYLKAIKGDINAIKLLVSLNDENPDFTDKDATTDGSNITIVLPNKKNNEE